jgi:perosamine synthetase
VALGQLGKLDGVVRRRREIAAMLTERLAGTPGLTLPRARTGAEHSWWKYPLLVDPDVVEGGTSGLASRLKTYSVASAPRYIQKPAFRCRIFREQNTFGSSRWPFTLARPEAVDYAAERFPGTFAYLDRVLVLPFNERYTEEHVELVADSVAKAAAGATA